MEAISSVIPVRNEASAVRRRNNTRRGGGKSIVNQFVSSFRASLTIAPGRRAVHDHPPSTVTPAPAHVWLLSHIRQSPISDEWV